MYFFIVCCYTLIPFLFCNSVYHKVDYLFCLLLYCIYPIIGHGYLSFAFAQFKHSAEKGLATSAALMFAIFGLKNLLHI